MTPYIFVEHSRRVPESSTVAACTGAPWRFRSIPAWILRRNRKAQLHWVSWAAGKHFSENRGQLFGVITGYRVVYSDQSVLLDVNGRFLRRVPGKFIPGSGLISTRGKTWNLISSNAFAGGSSLANNS